ncbi:MAG: hypothetical protein QOI58_2591 [Thermoanaerobaculia bacterium]|jgi:hypothetical protein|nr:hypothetical protein [Thermoanaerobaculia bacterium]
MPIDVDGLFNTYREAIKTARDQAPGNEGEWTRSSQESLNTMALIAIAEQLKRIADRIEVSAFEGSITHLT